MVLWYYGIMVLSIVYCKLHSFRGKDVLPFLSRVLVGDMSTLAPGHAALSLITNAEGFYHVVLILLFFKSSLSSYMSIFSVFIFLYIHSIGGIIDDCVVTRMAEEDAFYMVVNGANKHIDVAHFRAVMEETGMSPEMELRFEEQLVALQGPGAMKALAPLLPPSVDLTKVPFMSGFNSEVAGIEGCRVTRCGYTGEDGFEIAVSPERATELARSLLADENVKLAGLGARDSLRLEAGLCLHGNDISTLTTPAEAGLMWTIGGPKSARRTEQGFLGADAFLQENGKLKPVERKRVGLIGMKAPTRQGTIIQTPEGEPVGIVTSGTITPSLGKSIAMAYVKKDFAADGTNLKVVLRKGTQDCQVTKMPFVTARYYRVPEEGQ